MKRYNFVKIIGIVGEYPWMFECKHINDLMEHTERYMNTVIKAGVRDYFRSSLKTSGHYKTFWANSMVQMASINNKSPMMAGHELENKILAGKIKTLLNHGTIYLRENGSYTILTKDMSIKDRLVMDKMIYPNYTEEDIRITKWPNGEHFYASIGNFDVVDESGNQKWDSESEAREHAMKYLKTL